jgi:hypothetical protein
MGVKHIVIFGPPAVGKSTILSDIGEKSSLGKIKKVSIVDLEAFNNPSSNNLKGLTKGNVLIGAGAFDIRNLPISFEPLVFLPSLDDYLQIRESKKVRGVGNDKFHNDKGCLKVYKAFENIANSGKYKVFTNYGNILQYLEKSFK